MSGPGHVNVILIAVVRWICGGAGGGSGQMEESGKS